MSYAKVELSDCMSVRSIESVWHINLADVKGGNEKHDFPELFYVEKGSHTTVLDDIPYYLTEGQIIIYAPGAYHCGLPGARSTATVGIVAFEAEHCNIGAMSNRVITLTETQRSMIDEIISLGSELFTRPPLAKTSGGTDGIVLRAGASADRVQKFKHMFELFLIDVFGVNEHFSDNRTNYKKERFDRTVAFLRANMSTTLTIEDIAAAAAMSPSGLSALFKEQCGTSPITYFNTLKITEAQRLIRSTSLNFTEIAERLGICSVHYFSKLFKKFTGITLSEYVKTLNTDT